MKKFFLMVVLAVLAAGLTGCVAYQQPQGVYYRPAPVVTYQDTYVPCGGYGQPHCSQVYQHSRLLCSRRRKSFIIAVMACSTILVLLVSHFFGFK